MKRMILMVLLLLATAGGVAMLKRSGAEASVERVEPRPVLAERDAGPRSATGRGEEPPIEMAVSEWRAYFAPGGPGAEVPEEVRVEILSLIEEPLGEGPVAATVEAWVRREAIRELLAAEGGGS